MGAPIPQIITEDRASGAQVIDGSLRLAEGDGARTPYLKRTNSSTGNRRTWTFSGWVKRTRVDNSESDTIINYANTSTSSSGIEFGDYDSNEHRLRFNSFDSGNNMDLWSTQSLRDTSAWYHIMQVYDTTQSTDSNRVKMYINGEHITDWAAASYPNNRWPSQWAEGPFCYAGSPGGFIAAYHWAGSDSTWRGNFYASQFYLLDGQALGPENFGFTDPLTGVWRPKKYEVKAPNRVGKFFSANYAASDSFQANAPKLAAFDGVLTSRSACSSSGCTVTVSSIGVEVKHGLRVYAGYGSASVNGGTAVSFSGSAVGWQDLSFTGTLNTLAVTGNPSGGNANAGEIYAIEVDGVILVDNGGYGTTGFYLPFDGSAPIGQDQSGSGNNWTPQYLGGFVSLDNPIVSGATPILNTVEGGRVAVPGVKGQVGVAVTVYNSGSGNKYYLDGEEAKTLSYKRGQTVTFDTSDSTVSGHPFRFATAADAAGSTQYTSGSVTGASEGSAGAATTITIPTTAPENLYYYCTNHSGMGGSITGITTDWRVADPGAWKNVLAIPVSGTVGTVDVSGQVNPAGSSKKAVSIIGATEKGFPANFYGRTLYFDGSGDYLQLSSSTDFGLVEQDWTVEVWYYSTGITGSHGRLWYLEGSSSANIDGVYHSATNMSMGTTGVWSVGDGTGGDFRADTWNHIAVVHDSTNIRMYINGIQSLTSSGNFSNYSTKKLNIMTTDNNSFAGQSKGYLNDFRIYNGLAKYTSNFTPTSTNPDILLDTPSGAAYSSELTKSSAGSGVFGGNDSYLIVPNNSGGDLTLGTGNFTIEFFVYLKSLGTSGTVFIDWRYTAQGVYPVIWQDGSGLYYHTNSSNRITSPKIPIGVWTHVAVSKSGTSTKLFLDGVQQGGTYSDSNNYLAPPGGVFIGSMNLKFSTGYALKDGFMSNVRVIKGTALYTSNFTPPSAPLTNITNTKILCCQSNSSAVTASVAPDATGSASFNLPLSSAPFTDSSSNSYTVTNTGSVTTASAGTNNFNITNAASFDGSSQRLNMNSNVTLINAWTIDAWIKLDSSASGYNAIYNSGYTSSNNTYIYMSVNDDEKPYLEGGSAGGSTIAANAINKNQWYHFRAIQIPGDGMHLYVDGEKVVTHGQNITDMSSLGTDCIGSLISNGNNANNFHGLIGPVRYVGANLGPPPVGGLPTTAGALSNTLDIPIGLAGHAAASSFNPFDTNIDVSRGRETRYGTWNPLMKNSNVTLTEGNLVAKCTQNAWRSSFVDIGTKGGKWYFEMETMWIGNKAWIGICPDSEFVTCVNTHPSNSPNSYAGRVGDGIYRNNSTNQSVATGPKFPMEVGGVAMCAYDLDNGKFWVGSDGIWWKKSGGQELADPATGIGPGYTGINTSLTYHAAAGIDQYQWKLNCGQTPFKYPPPEGFNAICNANLPSPGATIPTDFAKPVIWTGNGVSGRGIPTGFAPDLVWLKRTNGTTAWIAQDTIRGATKDLYLNTTGAEYTDTSTINGFYSEGFNVGDAASVNSNTNTYAAYAWKAGGNNNTFNVDGRGYATFAASGTTAGTITPTGTSIGTKQGFSIIQYTGTGSLGTVPHGLNSAPDFLVVKRVNSSEGWQVYHSQMDATAPEDYSMELESTGARADTTNRWNDTAPTNSVFTVNTHNGVNASGSTYIAYLWHNIPGVQKFGTYTGNADSSLGPYVELGFRPALLICKNTGGTADWPVMDDVTNSYNPMDAPLFTCYANAQTADAGYKLDFLSNGFKVRNDQNSYNQNGYRYIYLAWAHQPEHNLYGGQSNAR